MTYTQVQQLEQKVLIMSLKYTSVTQSILCLILLMYVATMQCLNYSGHESQKQLGMNW